jgi:hypothetical protein
METTPSPGERSPIPEVEGLVIACDGSFGPVLMLSGNVQPKENGTPIYPHWKEVLRPGPLRDANGREWSITPQDIDDAVSDANRALLKGWRPPIQDRHYGPTKCYGRVTAARKNERGAMEWKHEFKGKEEADEALSLSTSLMVKPMLVPKFRDANGEYFKWFPLHSASVFNPQDKYLADYKPALAASGQQVNAVLLSPAQEDIHMDITPLRTALGDKATGKPDADVLALAATEYVAVSQKLSDQAEANGVLLTKLNNAEQALALSDEIGEEMDPRFLAIAAKGADADIRCARAENKINAKQAEWLASRVKSAPALALSADASTPSTIDDFITFASLGSGLARQPITRTPPAGVVPVTPEHRPGNDPALALSGEEQETPEQLAAREARLREDWNLAPKKV